MPLSTSPGLIPGEFLVRTSMMSAAARGISGGGLGIERRDKINIIGPLIYRYQGQQGADGWTDLFHKNGAGNNGRLICPANVQSHPSVSRIVQNVQRPHKKLLKQLRVGYESLSAFWRSSANFASISSERRFLGNARPSPLLSGACKHMNRMKITSKTGDIPSAPQEQPIHPTAPLFPPKDLTPVLPPPYIIQLDLSVRALYYPPLTKTQAMLRGWEWIMWVRQVRN